MIGISKFEQYFRREGGFLMGRFVPLSIPNFEGNERKYVNDAIEQGWVSTGGAYILKLEKGLAEFLNTDSVAACQNGTSGIHLSLVECGVQPGDMVLVPTLTFIAAVNPVRYQFANPVFIDCDDSLCMDPDKLRAFCERECRLEEGSLIHKLSGKCIKAVVVVHVFGNLADMEKIMEVASEYHLKVIEDATEALGSYYIKGRYAGKHAGTIGDFGVYSFNGNKIITTGGGGAVTARDAETVAHIRYLSTQAKDDEQYYVHHEVGYNYRMTNLQAALGVAQLEELPEFIFRKHKNYELYQECFEGFPFGKLLGFRNGIYSNQWFYSLEISMDRMQGTLRDIIKQLQDMGVQTRAVWQLIHEQVPYKEAIAYQIDRASYYSSCILNIPSSTQITEDDIRYVVGQVKKVLGEMADE